MSAPIDDASLMSEMGGIDLHDDDAMLNAEPPRRILRAECILSKRSSRFILVIETIQGMRRETYEVDMLPCVALARVCV